MPVRVLCVDDNPEVAEALRLALDRAGHECVGVLPDADALTGEAARLAPDIVLLDIDMPGRNPLDALRELDAADPSVRVIIVSGHVRRDLVDQAFEAGAWGYLSKTEGVAPVMNAIPRVLRGEVVMAGDVSQVLGP